MKTMFENEILYKSYNQFNYSKKALRINYKDKTYKIYNGGSCPVSFDKKTTTKFINEKIEELEAIGFKKI